MSAKTSSFFLAMATAMAFLPALAAAQDLSGTWERANGKARFRFEPCGADLCAVVVWIRPDIKKGKVGQTVFRKLVETSPNLWTGEAVNPENGRVYTGTMKLQDGKLHTRGCTLGGLICKSDVWARID